VVEEVSKHLVLGREDAVVLEVVNKLPRAVLAYQLELDASRYRVPLEVE